MNGPDTFSFSPSILASFGLPIERLCERAGVAPSNAWVTSDFFQIWAAADEEFDDRAAGLRFGAEGIDRGYGFAAIVALHASDLRRAIAALSLIEGIAFEALVTDKAFDADWIIEDANERGAKIVISQRRNRKAPLAIDGEMYEWRHLFAGPNRSR